MGNLPFRQHRLSSDKLEDQTSLSSLSSSSSSSQYVLPVSLCLDSYVDVGKALKKNASKSSQSMIPKKIIINAKFLDSMMNFPSDYHKRSLRRVLRRGCMEILLIGASGTAPRRVYIEEMNIVLERLRHDMIETMHLRNLSIQSANTRAGKPTQLVSNVKKFYNLQRIVIEKSRMEEDLLDEILAVLRSLPYLREVSLNLLDLEKDQLQAVEETLARLLRSSTTLESISLPHYPTSDSFWQALESSPSLTSLGFPCHEDTDFSRLQQLLVKKINLKRLELRDIHPETKFELLANGLQQNTTLESLTLILQDHRSTAAIWKCMIPVLKNDNFTLTQLDIFLELDGRSNCRFACPTLDFYLQQNRHSPLNPGRFHMLRENPTFEEWTKHMIKMARESDLSSLYYWLRVQPNLLPSH